MNHWCWFWCWSTDTTRLTVEFARCFTVLCSLPRLWHELRGFRLRRLHLSAWALGWWMVGSRSKASWHGQARPGCCETSWWSLLGVQMFSKFGTYSELTTGHIYLPEMPKVHCCVSPASSYHKLIHVNTTTYLRYLRHLSLYFKHFQPQRPVAHFHRHEKKGLPRQLSGTPAVAYSGGEEPSWGGLMAFELRNRWRERGHIMGISWEYHGNIMGISWEYHGNIMGISGKKSVCEKESLEKSLSLLCCETVLIRIFIFIGNAENDSFLALATYIYIHTPTSKIVSSIGSQCMSVFEVLPKEGTRPKTQLEPESEHRIARHCRALNPNLKKDEGNLILSQLRLRTP